jgi:hypothetical protein
MKINSELTDLGSVKTPSHGPDSHTLIPSGTRPESLSETPAPAPLGLARPNGNPLEVAPPSRPPAPGGDGQSDIGNHKEHRHKGKVGRLPKEIRDQLSQMIVDGVPYKEIKSRLGEHGRDLSINNISNWKTDGGLDEYIREQDRLYDCKLRYELLERVAAQNTGTANYQAGPKMAVALISEALIDLGPEVLRKSMQDDSRNAYRLLNSLARLLSGGLRCESHLMDLAERKASLEKPEETEGKGMSDEIQKTLINKLNLL